MAKPEVTCEKIVLYVNQPQAGIRIADSSGNHISKPTKSKNDLRHFVEWMITNKNVKNIVDCYLSEEDILRLIENLKKIENFVEDSKYFKRETVKLETEKVEKFYGFDVYRYTENFCSFERVLPSKIKVRITIKPGDFGLEPHPHMYVLLPFNHKSVKIKNVDGNVPEGDMLGKKCYCEWIPTKDDIMEIVITLAHSSKKHRHDLIDILKLEP